MKSQEQTTDNKSKTQINDSKPKTKSFFRRAVLPTIILNIIVWGGIALFLALRGHTTVNNHSTPDVKTEAVICRKTDAPYPYLQFASISTTTTQIEATYKKDELSKIYFSRDIYFNDTNDIETAFSSLSNSFGLALNKAGFDSFAFSRKLTNFSDHLNLSLNAEKDELDSKSAPFFMLKLNEADLADLTKGLLIENYQQQDFNCE